MGLWLSSRLSYPQRLFVEDPGSLSFTCHILGQKLFQAIVHNILLVMHIFCRFTRVQMVCIYIYSINLHFLVGRMLPIPYIPKSEASRLSTINPLFHEGIYAHLHIIWPRVPHNQFAGSCQIVFPNMSIAIAFWWFPRCQDFSDSVEPVDEELPVPRVN